jgi:hypothetical protein
MSFKIHGVAVGLRVFAAAIASGLTATVSGAFGLYVVAGPAGDIQYSLVNRVVGVALGLAVAPLAILSSMILGTVVHVIMQRHHVYSKTAYVLLACGLGWLTALIPLSIVGFGSATLLMALVFVVSAGIPAGLVYRFVALPAAQRSEE